MNTMKNALQEFLNDFSFSDNYKFLLKHYTKDSDLWGSLPESFLSKDNLFYDVDMDSEISEEIIDKIKEYDEFWDFLDGTIDIWYTDLIESIELFWDWIEDFWDKDNFYQNIALGQSNAYIEALTELQNKFVEYLESKIS